MLVTFISTIKKYLGISTNVREATKRPLEEESENEFEEVIFHDTEPQKKKRCSYVDHLLTSNAPGFSPVLNQISGLSGRKEENLNKVLDVKMSGHKNQQQKEGYGAEVIVTEERMKKWSDRFPCSISKSVSCTAEIENDFEALKRKEARNVDDLATCCNPPTHSSLADFRFVASSSGSVQPDFSAKQKSRNFDCLSSSRNDKTRMKKSVFKGPTITLLDRSLGRKKPSSFLSSRIKHCLVHKSFLHEEKMKYRQLLQQYTEEHYLTPNSKVMSHKVSSLAASPVGMVSRSQWTPFMTKKKQEEIENMATSSSSLRMLPSANNSV
ncbi:uncharacterized protein LOC123510036 isoform X2 [Portunus trituberculatus]|uniref:uncharacterized protein LOC123510036 isoform X2 n=1 Tax=Portunus trituberculatus TaxID=210409 RepID=UPI001E1CC0CA|nr:uncharacterized protein LOC123510036 isoform X2 [Portunus trituberculatus]